MQEFMEYDAPACKTCGWEMEWDDCFLCGGDGSYEHVPDSEEPWTSIETCDSCNGKGGSWYCPHAENHIDGSATNANTSETA